MRLSQLPFAAAIVAASTVTALAHASLETSAATPGAYKAVLVIPHGCDGQSTHTVRLEIPAGYVDVKPMPKPGWSIETVTADYARPYELHGKTISSGVVQVIWSGGDLPEGFFDEFVVGGTLTGVAAGDVLYFKATQLCANGEVAWHEEPAAGQDPHALEHPAPALTILAAAGGHGDHGATGPVTAGSLEISSFWARAMLPGQPAGGGYLTIGNKGGDADRLVAVSSPNAGKVEVHKMEMTDNVMVMRPVEGGLEIPAGGSVELKPGGLHVMFMSVTEPFREGATVLLTLDFEKAGKVEVALPVRSAAGDDHSNH
jgi:uncharacterized protein YcnI